MEKESMSKVARAIENFTELGNTVKVLRFAGSKFGKPVINKLDEIGISPDGKREIVLTNKLAVAGLIMDSSDINDKRLIENTKTEIKEQKELLAQIENQ